MRAKLLAAFLLACAGAFAYAIWPAGGQGQGRSTPMASGVAKASAPAFIRAVAVEAWDLDQRGQALMKSGRTRKALALFNKARKDQPGFVLAYVHSAQVYLALELPPAALLCLDEAVKLAPNDPDIHYETGRALYRMGYARPAQRSFNRAVELNPAYLPVIARTLDEMNGEAHGS